MKGWAVCNAALRRVPQAALILAAAVAAPAALASAPLGGAGGTTVSRGDRVASLFTQTYNAEAKTNHWPRRIVRMACQANGEAMFDCELKLQRPSGTGTVCGVLVIDNSFEVWVNHKVACAKLFRAQGGHA